MNKTYRVELTYSEIHRIEIGNKEKFEYRMVVHEETVTCKYDYEARIYAIGWFGITHGIKDDYWYQLRRVEVEEL